MNSDRLRTIEVDKIYLREDVVKRDIDQDAVSDLVESIRVSGLHTPIRVRPISKYLSGVRFDAWELIAGHHRVEAVKTLGWSEIDANIQDIDDTRAEIAMIDENLRRRDLTAAHFCYATYRLKELYELLNPEAAYDARPGRAGKSRNNCDNSEPADRYTLAASKASGKSERSHQLGFTIAKKFKEKLGSAERVLDVVGTSLDSITELDSLSKLNEAQIATAIHRAKGGEDVTAKVARQEKAIEKAAPVVADERPFQKGEIADGDVQVYAAVENIVREPVATVTASITEDQSSIDDAEEEERRFWAFFASLSPKAQKNVIKKFKAMSY